MAKRFWSGPHGRANKYETVSIVTYVSEIAGVFYVYTIEVSIVLYIREIVWLLATGIALLGVFALGVSWWVEGEGYLIIGVTALIVLSLLSVDVRMQRDEMRPASGSFTLFVGLVVLLVAGVIGFDVTRPRVPANLQIVSLATGLQALLLIMDIRPPEQAREKPWLPGLGHGAIFVGSILALDQGPFEPAVALLAYAIEFVSLILHAFWMRQLVDGAPPGADTMTSWETVLLFVLLSGLLSVALVSFTLPPGEFSLPPDVRPVAVVVAGSAVVLSIALLSQPPPAPDAVASFTGTVTTVLQHGTTIILLLNILLLAIILLSTHAFYVIIGVFFAWLTAAAVIEYSQVVYAHRQKGGKKDSPPPLEANAPVTVIVVAASEANVLPKSLANNLAALGRDVPFIIVPMAKSDDGTVEIAYDFATRYDHIRVVEGGSGSKAGDLNEVWSHVDTEYAFILDADESITRETIARGLQTLRERPEVGVVQGRKAATRPETDTFSRFVSVERQHSTWVDHPFVDDVLGAGHFGGSVAMLRREVPLEVDGWDPDVLTEDIDFTLRLYSETEWKVAYDSEMVGWEYQPATARALVHQRVRWVSSIVRNVSISAYSRLSCKVCG